MTSLITTHGLGRRYGRHWALVDCDLDIPAGHVVGLVGPNGAGKTTLLNLVTGQLAPSAGSLTVLGRQPDRSAHDLARVGYVAQDTPTYAGLTVDEHLRLGAHLNPRWDDPLARTRVERLGLSLNRRAGKLSGGQRAQLALTLGVAKRPDLLVLDEPVAALDPLARRDFLRGLMEACADQEFSVVLSSHLVSDLERVCDHLVVLVGGEVRLAGDVDSIVASHLRLTGPRRDAQQLPRDYKVIGSHHTDAQSTYVVSTNGTVHDPRWTVSALSLEDVVLAHMAANAGDGHDRESGSGRDAQQLEVLR